MDNVLDFVTYHKIKNLNHSIEQLQYAYTIAGVEGSCPVYVDGNDVRTLKTPKDILKEIYRLQARLQILNLSKEA